MFIVHLCNVSVDIMYELPVYVYCTPVQCFC